MNYTVKSCDLSELTFNESDTLRSILQNVAIILATRVGTVPMYREFGTEHSILDRPIPAVRPMLLAEIKTAIERFEPRVRVTSVTLDDAGSMEGRISPVVEVEIIDEQES